LRAKHGRELPRMVDLSAVANELERADPKNKLIAAVRNAGRAQSCIADVSLAQTTLEALAQLSGKADWAPVIHRVAAEHALLANAVFLYARATDTGGRAGERGPTSIRNRLPADERVTHDWIVHIRNAALAHVRPNEPLSDELWHREIVFAVELQNGAWQPAAMTRRVQVNARLIVELRTLLQTAELLLKETYYRRIDYVASALERMTGAADLFPKHLLDPIEVFGSATEAARAIGSPRPGERLAGVINV